MKRIYVTSPLLPDLGVFKRSLKKIWKSKWITNNGAYHEKFEKALSEYLGVKYISVFTNGTLPLIAALQALDLKEGEVITTPYSFVATTHSIIWQGLTPVFVDVDPETGNIDPKKIEEAITSKTVAIMPVHVYGNPCKIEEIQSIADKYNLKVIYDAAHVFGVQIKGNSILNAGDISTLSFHATKVFNTVEGGAVICNSEAMKNRIDKLRNFGFVDEVTVDEIGLNAKMDEIRSAYGLINLKNVDKAIKHRQEIVNFYRKELKEIPGIRFINDMPDVKHNYSYFPIFIDKNQFGISRDDLYNLFKENNIYTRRYFYPLISNIPVYSNLKSAARNNLPNANLLADSVLCLPLYADLKFKDVKRIVKIIQMISFKNRGM